MRVLFIDDEMPSIDPAKVRLEEDGHICKYAEFSGLIAAIKNEPPDIIVLDMMEGLLEDPHGGAGKSSFAEIWSERFCPIVVYSANPDLIAEESICKGEHPLIRIVKKGRGSEDFILDAVKTLEPCAEGFNDLRKEVDNAISLSLRDLAPRVFGPDGSDLEQAFQHMGRRRVAACLDDRSLFGEKLIPWGQYIYPPLSQSPKQCDVLLQAGSDPKDPASYRLVLTPSCDLVKTAGREPKVCEVLCAKCCSPEGFLSKAGVSSAPAANKLEKHKAKLGVVLNAGFLEEYVPLPGFFEVIPPMVANLKTLELVGYGAISNEGGGGTYIRVASVDSPFREQISWAYQNAGCRPGVPDRNLDLWTSDYISNGE